MRPSTRTPCLPILLLAFICAATLPFANAFQPGAVQRQLQLHRLQDGVTPLDDDAAASKNIINVDDSLTLQELTLRFQEVLDHFRATQQMSEQDIRRAMLRTRLPQLALNRCYVNTSTLPDAGKGLFASRDIGKDEIITLYPGDALLLWTKDVGDFSADVGVLLGDAAAAKNCTAAWATSDEARDYEIILRPGESLVADVELTDDPAYLGHLVNDGAACLDESQAARNAYAQATVQRYNAALVSVLDCHYAVVAARNIGAGEEVFLSYGLGYWTSRLRKQQQPNESASPTARRNANSGAVKGLFRKKVKAVRNGGGGGFG